MISGAASLSLPDRSFAPGILDHFQRSYRGPSGLFVTTLDEAGRTIDPHPPLADFGDILPFLHVLGLKDMAEEQIQLAVPLLCRGLVANETRISSSDNHDYLLGLVEIAALTRSAEHLAAAVSTARELHRALYRKAVAVRDVPIGRNPPARGLWRTSPFNGGYIELFVDLYGLTGDPWFLAIARQEAAFWIANPFFRSQGLFRRVEFIDHPILSSTARFLQRGPLVRLFKDNTNLMQALVALAAVSGDPLIERAVRVWMQAFQRRFLRGGLVPLHLDRFMRADAPHLKAAFASIDLLCDAHAVFPACGEWLNWAAEVAEAWILLQWACGLFPAAPGADADHLDANADIAIALWKLADRTGEERYRESAHRCIEGITAHHPRRGGYVLSVDRQGRTVDGRVFVKYQSLLLKLNMLPSPGATIHEDPLLRMLLRDR